MQCPFRIEPHQIQGLDFIHIFPVIQVILRSINNLYVNYLQILQWLVKRSMEFRQEMSNFVESFAINQFNKHFQVENKQAQATKKVLENINTVNNLYRPYRHYKRKTAPPEDLQSRIQVTLLEYGQRGDLKNVVADASPEDIMKENETEEVIVCKKIISLHDFFLCFFNVLISNNNCVFVWQFMFFFCHCSFILNSS